MAEGGCGEDVGERGLGLGFVVAGGCILKRGHGWKDTGDVTRRGILKGRQEWSKVKDV